MNCSLLSDTKKHQAFLVTLVERRTSCIVAWSLHPERTTDQLQALVDTALPARFYYYHDC